MAQQNPNTHKSLRTWSTIGVTTVTATISQRWSAQKTRNVLHPFGPEDIHFLPTGPTMDWGHFHCWTCGPSVCFSVTT